LSRRGHRIERYDGGQHGRRFLFAGNGVRLARIDHSQGSRLAMSSETTLDARGLTCPLPILRAKKALKTLADGAVLTVLATDPSSVRDFATFCRQTGNELLETAEDAEGVFRYRIRKVD